MLAHLSLDLLKCEQFAAADAVLRECLAIREKKEADAWTTFNTLSLLGGALLGQKQYADAEPLLVKGYEGMKDREQTVPPEGRARLGEAVARLVQLYEALDKKEDAARWRQELPASKPATQPAADK